MGKGKERAFFTRFSETHHRPAREVLMGFAKETREERVFFALPILRELSSAELVHRRQLVATEIFDFRRQAAMLCDPGADLLRIDFHQQLRAVIGGDFTRSGARAPGCVKSKASP